MSGIVSGLAREPYPRGRGETRLRSTSSSMRVQVSGTVSGLASEPYPRG